MMGAGRGWERGGRLGAPLLVCRRAKKPPSASTWEVKAELNRLKVWRLPGILGARSFGIRKMHHQCNGRLSPPASLCKSGLNERLGGGVAVEGRLERTCRMGSDTKLGTT